MSLSNRWILTKHVFMQTFHAEIVVEKDGKLQLHHVPFSEGETVHVFVSSATSDSTHPLKGSVLRYEQPFAPVAELLGNRQACRERAIGADAASGSVDRPSFGFSGNLTFAFGPKNRRRLDPVTSAFSQRPRGPDHHSHSRVNWIVLLQRTTERFWPTRM